MAKGEQPNVMVRSSRLWKTRANYVELALSLSAEDFLLVFGRFIGLYTQPKIVHSDNGTNFVTAEKELLEPVRQLHQSPV